MTWRDPKTGRFARNPFAVTTEGLMIFAIVCLCLAGAILVIYR